MRSQADILNEIMAKKATFPTLDGLSTSSIARWKMVMNLVSQVIHDQEVKWEELRSAIQTVLDSSRPGTLPWYRDQAFKWQSGHSLILNDFVPGYSVDDPQARIVTRASAQEASGNVLIKVAKDVGGQPGPLTPAEILGLKTFFQQIRFAGTRTDVLSLSPGWVQVFGEVLFDPQIGAVQTQINVEEAISLYLESTPFDGEIGITALVDAVQLAVGVKDFVLDQFQIDDGTGPVVIARVHNPLAGYAVPDPNQPLASSITYTAHV